MLQQLVWVAVPRAHAPRHSTTNITRVLRALCALDLRPARRAYDMIHSQGDIIAYILTYLHT